MEAEYQEIDEFKKMTFAEYREDKVKRRNIERWTENIINATIDIAKIILASEKKRMPRTYEQALLNFGLFIRLKEEEAEELSTFPRLRNILAHEYVDITYGSIKKFIDAFPAIYQKIFNFLSQYMKE